LWAQDAWRFAPGFKLTLGGREEAWRAFDGFNLSTTTAAATGAITGTSAMVQPGLQATRFSPKGSLSFEPNKQLQFTASVGIANRFPTVTELYQNATVAGIVVFPNPNLAPERALATELAAERKFDDGKVRLSLFEDDTSNALISQNGVVAGTTTPTAFVTNVDRVRDRGIELAWQKSNVFIPRVEWFGSVTYVDAVIVSDPTFVGTNGSTATGKRVPNVPMWRATFGGTYRPNDAWSWTLVGRYQSKTYSTLDNTDIVPNVFQAFDPFLVFDTRLQYKVDERGSLDFGIDNLTNEKYHLFHPFPQRTYVVQGRIKF
jgi:iron complex outermembrane receptor protein